jgi:hypothetical protein
MSDPHAGSPKAHRQDRAQQAFDRVAEGLDLRLERSSSNGNTAGEDVRIVGTAYAAVMAKATQFDLMDSPPPVGASDDAAITAVITAYESLSPEDLTQQWQQFALDPHLAIADTWFKALDKKDFRHWMRSEELAQAQQDYPPFTPRHVQITNVNIVYIGDARAVATYHLQEDFTNGKVAAGNSAASLAKLEGSQWRIVAIHKRVKKEITP